MFDTWRRNFWDLFVVYLILGVVTAGIESALSYGIFGVIATGGFSGLPVTAGISRANLGLLALYLILGVVALVVVTTVVQGAMSEYSVRRFRGETMTVRQAINRGVAKFVSVLGALLLLVLIVVGIVVLPLLLLISVATAAGADATLAALLLYLLVAMVVVIYLALGLALFAPAIMMENTSAIGGLSRSWNLMRGHRASLFGAVLILAILDVVIQAVLTIPAGFSGVAAIQIAAGVIAGAIVNSWFVVLAAVVYDLLARPYPAPPGGGPGYLPGTSAEVPFANAPSAPPGATLSPR